MRSLKWLTASLLGAQLLSWNGMAGDWALHEQSNRTWVEKIRSKENAIKELSDLKKKATDQDQLADVLDKIVKAHDELKKLHKGFADERRHQRFEHPEQGQKVEASYDSIRLKSIDELESESGLDAQLSKLKNKVAEKYGVPATPQPSVTPSPKPKVEKIEIEEAKRIKLSK